ncbi:hypothetical protein N1851_034100 [Merluccius polli]|uniref:Uncharacterized protein n=1 Tax=Merluccius polli TaxID=89951 RepID=A0AA47NMX9_MERPO|nr:hypothetical protein N1851_034100 [Merluccius polli]
MRSSASASSTASARICAQAERAALLAKSAALQQRHIIEEEEQQLEQQMVQLQKKRESLDLQAELSANTAKLEYLKNAETEPLGGSALDAMNTNLDENMSPFDEPVFKPAVRTVRPKEHVNLQFPFSQNQLTSLLIQQQRVTTLPKANIAVFDGNILEYQSFINLFDHIIESKTDNNQDRLLFLIQYTKGHAQDLVKSCQHMDANRGYRKARELLEKHFGNEYKISRAYIEKALSWPMIKSEDSRTLQDFALFMRSCCNAMENLEYMEELNTISNMRKISSKLPYKLRERWRVKACELQQRYTRVRMTNLVSFIEKQATIVSDPAFGDIQESYIS